MSDDWLFIYEVPVTVRWARRTTRRFKRLLAKVPEVGRPAHKRNVRRYDRG